LDEKILKNITKKTLEIFGRKCYDILASFVENFGQAFSAK